MRCENAYHHLLLIQKNKTLEFNRDIEIPMFFLYTKLKTYLSCKVDISSCNVV